MIKKLISGGQTGADISIVAVGSRLGIPTGGIVPKGWKTEQGPAPELERFGFTESDSDDYADRTRRNIEQSDATLILAADPASDGTRLTIDHADRVGKPFLVIDPFEPTAVVTIGEWLNLVQPAVLNVAGNRESKSPGIALRAGEVLDAALQSRVEGQTGL
jgi:hypothetical protein